MPTLRLTRDRISATGSRVRRAENTTMWPALGTDRTPDTISPESRSPLTPPSRTRTHLSRRTAPGARTIADRSAVPIHRIKLSKDGSHQ